MKNEDKHRSIYYKKDKARKNTDRKIEEIDCNNKERERERKKRERGPKIQQLCTLFFFCQV